jgi:germination protein M
MKKIIIFFILLALSLSLLSGCTQTIEVKVYYGAVQAEEVFLEAETRTVKDNADKYKSAIEELIKGPASSDLYPTLPKSVKVNAVSVENGTAIVDLSKEILTDFTEISPSSTTETLAIFSIVNTITEFEEINQVKIIIDAMESGTIEGRSIEDFWGHIGLYEKFERNEQIILK